MKRMEKKLTLSRETLRQLSDTELSKAGGGITRTCCNSCSDGCETIGCTSWAC